jgi:hypothetical protein
MPQPTQRLQSGQHELLIDRRYAGCRYRRQRDIRTGTWIVLIGLQQRMTGEKLVDAHHIFTWYRCAGLQQAGKTACLIS